MEKAALAKLVEQGLSTRAIAASLGTSPTTVRYWIHKYRLLLKQRSFVLGYEPVQSPRKCCQCGEIDPAKFYGRKRTMCGSCHNAYTTKVGQEKRLKAITYSGGQCQLCGFNEHPYALDFHHRDRSAKDPKYKSMRGWSWARTLAELKKCILLCKNCHAAVHAGIKEIPDGV